MATIAFLGLGNMGGPMCANLVKAGHSVRAFDVAPAAIAKAAEAGAVGAASIAEAVADAEVVVTMLPAGAHAREAYLGAGGVMAHAPKGALFIDCSTIDVATAREIAAAAGEASFAMVDSPVSGGVAGAAAATLTFMVGGADAAFARARPVLEAMGKRVVHAGQSGNGQAAKIANNMLLGISMIGTCEAFDLARRLGLEPATFFEISSAASGQCWSMTSYCPAPGPVPTAPSNRDYQPGFTVAMMLKDLKLAVSAADAAGVDAALGKHAEAIYAAIDADGKGGLDFSVVYRLLGER